MYFFNKDISVTIYVIDLKLSVCILNILLQGRVPQIFYLGPVECGTTQGLILGTQIYIIYVNNVLNVLDCENDIHLYSDDMLIIAKEKNIQQKKMDEIYKWCVSNKLTINDGKTKYMILNLETVEAVSGITIGNQVIGKVKQCEYL